MSSRHVHGECHGIACFVTGQILDRAHASGSLPADRGKLKSMHDLQSGGSAVDR